MHVDLAGVLAEALQDARVVLALAQHLKPAIREALTEQAADSWLTAAQASRYLYGDDGCAEAFRKLRGRHPELDRLSHGSGKLRRWRRSDLDTFMRGNLRAQRRRQGAHHDPQK